MHANSQRKDYFSQVNHIFYACGVICSVLKIVQKDQHKTIREALFEVQFKKNTEKGERSKMVFRNPFFDDLHYYELGLNVLKEINAELSFYL